MLSWPKKYRRIKKKRIILPRKAVVCVCLPSGCVTKQKNLKKKNKSVTREANILLRKGDHLLLKGPNGIGKSTLLESIVRRSSKGITVGKDVKIGYYRQDFSTLN